MAEARQQGHIAAPLQTAAVLPGPVAWAADLMLSYAVVHHACSTGHHYVLHAISIVCLVIALAGAFLCYHQFQAARHGHDEGGSPVDRSHFVALLGVLTNLWFALVIVAMAVPRWIVSPCD